MSPSPRMAEGPPRRLVLLRHGRTAWNAEGRAQGHADVPLDDVGRAQAAEVAPVVAGLDPELLWSSDLARAVQTAAYVEEATGLTARTDPRLREFDVGERTGLTLREFAERSPEEHAAWERRGNDVLSGAEKEHVVRERMVAACLELTGAVGPGGTAVAVTHGASLRVAVVALLGWPAELRGSLGVLENCAMAVLSSPGDEGEWRLDGWGVRPDFAPVTVAR